MPGLIMTTQAGSRFYWIGEKNMNPKPIEKARDPILRTAIYALKRAAKRARLEAERTGTCLVVRRGKTWVRISPKSLAGSKK
jgi:hypothetical protein